MSYSLRGTTLGQSPSIGGLGDAADDFVENWLPTRTCPVGQTWDSILGGCV